MTRKPESEKAVALKKAGAEVVFGDFEDRASVEKAAKGVDVAFIVATPYEQGPSAEIRTGKNAVEAVHAAGVPFIVYSSVSDADQSTGIPHFDSKFEIEKVLKGLGPDYAIIAPVFFMENLFAPWVSQGYANGVLAIGVQAGRKLQVISLPEIAQLTALAVENPEAFRGKRVNIASDEVTPEELARGISEASGKKIAYVPVPVDQIRAQSGDMARMFEWFNRSGYDVEISKLKAEYPTVNWTTFRTWSMSQDWSRVVPKG